MPLPRGSQPRGRGGRLSQRKNNTIKAAGMNGPHLAFRPNATSVRDPPLMSSMIVPAQASALMRFSAVNLIALTSA